MYIIDDDYIQKWRDIQGYIYDYENEGYFTNIYEDAKFNKILADNLKGDGNNTRNKSYCESCINEGKTFKKTYGSS